jgi:hypothetical protein
MDDSVGMNPEPAVQPMFSKFKLFSSLSVALPIFACGVWLKQQPNRWPGPDRVVEGRAVVVAVGGGTKAWHLTAADARFGGLSALAVDRGALLALSDSGAVVRFAPPGPGPTMRFALHDLPAGPGSAFRKSMRDSESLLADASGTGWWVGFESRHSLWRFDRSFRRVLETRWLAVDWPFNKGAEALVGGGRNQVMALPEGGGRASGGNFVAPAWTSDATRLPDGRLVLLIRRPTWRGFANRLRIAAGAGKPARTIALDLAPLDNMEGIAAAPLPGGGTRLWIVSDDNFRPWMRTLLVALDLGPEV